MFKQLIIARRDLNMSPGKLAAQVSHASITFLLEKLYKLLRQQKNQDYWLIYDALEREGPEGTLTCGGGRNISFIINIVLILLLLTACVEENNRYPRLEYIPTMRREEVSSSFFFVIEIEKSIQILKWRGRTISPKNFQFFPKYTPPSFTW